MEEDGETCDDEWVEGHDDIADVFDAVEGNPSNSSPQITRRRSTRSMKPKPAGPLLFPKGSRYSASLAYSMGFDEASDSSHEVIREDSAASSGQAGLGPPDHAVQSVEAGSSISSDFASTMGHSRVLQVNPATGFPEYASYAATTSSRDTVENRSTSIPKPCSREENSNYIGYASHLSPTTETNNPFPQQAYLPSTSPPLPPAPLAASTIAVIQSQLSSHIKNRHKTQTHLSHTRSNGCFPRWDPICPSFTSHSKTRPQTQNKTRRSTFETRERT